MGILVIVAYKPKEDKSARLKELVKEHVQVLRAEELVTEREPVLMESKNGIIIEVFEWKSPETIEKAHTNPVVQKMWEEFSNVCNYIPAGQVEEFSNLFSEFTPL